MPTNRSLKKGDVLFMEWNNAKGGMSIDYFQIVSFEKGSNSVRLVQIQKNRFYDNAEKTSGTCKPNRNCFLEEPFLRKVEKDGSVRLTPASNLVLLLDEPEIIEGKIVFTPRKWSGLP